MCCHFLLQGVFPTQGSNPYLLHCQVDSLLLHNLRIPVSNHNTILFSISKKANFAVVDVYSAFFLKHIFPTKLIVSFLHLFKGINITCDYCLPLMGSIFFLFANTQPELDSNIRLISYSVLQIESLPELISCLLTKILKKNSTFFSDKSAFSRS